MTVWRTSLRIVTVAATAGAAWLLYRNIGRNSFEEITGSITAIPLLRLAAGLGFAAASYLCLSLFDLTALYYVRKPLPYRRVLLTSFTSLSIGHNIGLAALSSGAIRYRYYSRYGLKTGDIGKLILFCGTTVAIGILALTGAALVLAPAHTGILDELGIPESRGAGLLLLAAVALYPASVAVLPPVVRIRRLRLENPGVRLAMAQIAIGAVNFALVAACLHQILLGVADVSYPAVAKGYAIANLLAILSHVPGGLGVLEATISYILPNAATIGTLIVFRTVYFLLPLMLGLPLLAASELFHARTRTRRKRYSEERLHQSGEAI